MLILYEQLLGVDEKDIIKDYTLTTVGLKPVLPMLYKKYQNGENLQGLVKLCTAKYIVVGDHLMRARLTTELTGSTP